MRLHAVRPRLVRLRLPEKRVAHPPSRNRSWSATTARRDQRPWQMRQWRRWQAAATGSAAEEAARGLRAGRQQTCVPLCWLVARRGLDPRLLPLHATFVLKLHTRACVVLNMTRHQAHTTQKERRTQGVRSTTHEREERNTRTHRFRQRCHCDWRHRRCCRRRRHLLQEVEARVRDVRDSRWPQSHCELQLRM